MKQAILSGLLMLSAGATFAQTPTSANPLYYAYGYNVFTKSGLTFKSAHTDGPVATGGNLTLNGSTNVAQQTSGTYPNGLNNTANYSLLIGGKIIYTNGGTSQVNNGNLRLANTAGTSLYDHDNQTNPNAANLQATPGAYNQTPLVQLQHLQTAASAAGASGIDFPTAFAQLANNSVLISSFGSTTTCSDFNYISVPATQNPQITLVEGKINYLNLTLAQLTSLNSMGSITFTNSPAATRLLIINVTGNGAYTWQPPNMGGISEPDGKYILINFPDVTSLELGGSNSIYGTVLAPNADVNKSGANNNNGQIVANSLIINYGEIHYYPFAGTITSCVNPVYTNVPPPINVGTTPLPITAVTLKAGNTNGAVQLDWNAAADNLSASYTAERSTDGKNFIALATQETHNTFGAQAYRFTDKESPAGTVLYRIRITSKDGATGYSNTVQVRNAAAAQLTFLLAPVPFHDALNITLSGVATDEQYTALLSDISGRVLASAVAAQRISLQGMAALAPGMYVLQVKNAGGQTILTKKVVKE